MNRQTFMFATIDEVNVDFDTVYISPNINRLNNYLVAPNIFSSRDANGKVIVVGNKCFMYVFTNATEAETAILSIRCQIHFVKPKVIRVEEPVAGSLFEQQKRWIANLISLCFIPDVDFESAEYF